MTAEAAAEAPPPRPPGSELLPFDAGQGRQGLLALEGMIYWPRRRSQASMAQSEPQYQSVVDDSVSDKNGPMLACAQLELRESVADEPSQL